MGNSTYRMKLAPLLALVWLGLVVSPAAAAGPPYELDPVLSLTGSCNVSMVDPIPDPPPPCAESPHPPAGRFDRPRSVAIDTFGNEYVASYSADGTKGRIDIFDDEGEFITELSDPFGPESVAVDSKGNLYAWEWAVGGDSHVVRYSPTAYKPESGEIAYGNPRVVIDPELSLPANGGVAIDRSTDHLFVAGSSFIKEYGSAEEVSPTEPNKLLNTITHEKLVSANWAAVDAERRRLYTSFCKNEIQECGVLVFEADAPYGLLEEIDGSTLPLGEFRSQKGWTSIAVDEETGHFFVDDLELTDNVYEFNEDYEYQSTITNSAFVGGEALQIAISNAVDAKNHRYLFVPVPSGAGRALAFKPPSECLPKVSDVSASNIAEREAELRASVDPCGGETHYAFLYVTETEFEESGFEGAQVGGEGTLAKGSLETQVFGLLSGLAPGTAYRFRVVAENLVGEKASEGSFVTYADAPTTDKCPNQALRSGLSALLPDCRAYELVTPADTNGRPPKGIGFSGDLFSTVHASPLGDAVSFAVEGGSLPGTGGAGGWHGDPYHSIRGAAGWSTTSIGPSGTESTIPVPGGVSPDQAHSFWIAGGEGSAVMEGGAHYVRYPDGRSELIGRGSLDTDPTARGMLITEDGAHIIFRTINIFPTVAQQLEPDAPPTGTQAVYDRTSDEVTHVVSLLPGDVTPAAGGDAFYIGASADGEGIAFRIGKTLYLRVGNAATYEIGENVAFAGVSEGGERIFYVAGGDLFAFDSGSEEVINFTNVGNAAVVNVAPDGTRAYFVSTTALSGEENPNGATPQDGQQNLYLSEEGAIRFVGIVTKRDVEGELNSFSARVDGIGIWTEALATGQPAKDVSRITPDGLVLLFKARANLDGYDSNGFPQLYRYDSVADRLHCVSCNPTGLPVTAGASLQSISSSQSLASPFVTAFDFIPNLTADGKRVFFESDEALVSTDIDDVKDVYEWEEQGAGSCNRSGGCVYLISSGQSERDNYLYAVSRSGDDVFFLTDDVLVPGDDDTSSIYDARVDGGFPHAADVSCDGEGCRPNLAPPPSPPEPRSELGNATSRPGKACPRGKRKVKRHGKVRCVKKQRKHRHRKAGTKKGVGK